MIRSPNPLSQSSVHNPPCSIPPTPKPSHPSTPFPHPDPSHHSTSSIHTSYLAPKNSLSFPFSRRKMADNQPYHLLFHPQKSYVFHLSSPSFPSLLHNYAVRTIEERRGAGGRSCLAQTQASVCSHLRKMSSTVDCSPVRYWSGLWSSNRRPSGTITASRYSHSWTAFGFWVREKALCS